MLGTRESWLIRTDQPGPRKAACDNELWCYGPTHALCATARKSCCWWPGAGRAVEYRYFRGNFVVEWLEQCCLSCCAPSHGAQLSEVSCFVARLSCGRRGSGGAADRRGSGGAADRRGSGGAAARSGHGRAVEAEKARWPMHDRGPAHHYGTGISRRLADGRRCRVLPRSRCHAVRVVKPIIGPSSRPDRGNSCAKTGQLTVTHAVCRHPGRRPGPGGHRVAAPVSLGLPGPAGMLYSHRS